MWAKERADTTLFGGELYEGVVDAAVGLGAAGIKWGVSSHLGEGSEAKPGQRGNLSGRESLRVQTLELGVHTLSAGPCGRLLRSGEPCSE